MPALLSPREREVLAKLAEGFQQKEIPDQLPERISVRAVRVYLARARLKLEARTNYQLIAIFVLTERGLPLSADQRAALSPGPVVTLGS